MDRSTQSEDRKAKARERMQKAKASETAEQAEQRKSRNRERMAEKRRCQSQGERVQSQLFDRERKTKSRATETAEKRDKRLRTVKEQTTQARAAETPDKRETRMDKYNKLQREIHEQIVNSLYKDSSWICNTCHGTMNRGQMPAQAWANGLQLSDPPEELRDLKPLELRLISQRIPFMKMIGLPKGQQKAIHGPAINVPTKLDSVCSLLPRLPTDAQILPMKLKRKLMYKGHYLYDYIRPQKVIGALRWLKQHNPLYKDITICEDWEAHWQEEDQDLWEALINQNPDDTTDMDTDPPITYTPDMSGLSMACNPPAADNIHVIADHHGYSVEDVASDVNCFFSAAHIGMTDAGIQSVSPNVLRQQVVQYLKTTDNITRYKDFIADPGQLHSRLEHPSVDNGCGYDVEMPEDDDFAISLIPDRADRQQEIWNRYVNRLESGAWADNVSIQAVADMLQVEIHILATLNPDHPTVVTPVGDFDMLPAVIIGLIGQQHYVALHKKPNDSVDDNNQQSSSDDNHAEDQQALEETTPMRGLQFETCMQEDDPQDPNDIHSIAPGENQRPKAFLTDENFELLANPDKYPHGDFGYSVTRQKKLTFRKYFNQRILDADGRFAKDVEYLLAAQYVVEAKQVSDDSSIALRQTRDRVLRGGGVNAGLIRDAHNMKSMLRTDAAVKFLKNVRGSPAYWHKVLYDLLAMVRQLGTPTWFLTLSAADMQWPEIIQSIGRQYGQTFTDEAVAAMSWNEKCNWLRANPVTAARQFQYRLEVFFHDFLCSAAQPIGEVDFFIRVEFQARGSPHAHTIIWIKDAPRLRTHSDEEICDFINRYQTCNINDDSMTFQQHRHSATCKRGTRCRFAFPHAPSSKTIIARPPVEGSESALSSDRKVEILNAVKKCLNDENTEADITLADLLNKAKVTDADYHRALSMSNTGKTVILKRPPAAQWTNSFNEDILRTWKANMDLQYILDPYSCMMYVTSYMMKSEKAMSELLSKVSKEAGSEDIKAQLNKVGSTFLNHREVSAQEAAYRLLSIPLKKSSRTVVFINTSPKDKRVAILKPASVISGMDQDDENIFCVNLIDRYAARPRDLDNISLAEFAATYAMSYRNNEEQDHSDHLPDIAEDLDAPSRRNERITLQNQLGVMYKRSRECVIRFHKEREDGEPKYRYKLMLYWPWRSEDELLGQYESFQQHYEDVEQTVKTNEDRYTFRETGIDQALDDLQEYGPPQHAWDLLAPGAQEQ